MENNTQLITLGIHFSRIIQEICQLRKAIFSIVYNILQPNFAILLRLGCSFNGNIFSYFHFFQNFVEKVKGPFLYESQTSCILIFAILLQAEENLFTTCSKEKKIDALDSF